ncbi:hypothetical protein D3C78_1746580 [compost metagenome]
MLVEQGAGIEVVAVAVHPVVVPAQVRAALDADRRPAAQARVAVAHGPAQVAFALGALVEAIEIEAQFADVGVQLAEVAAYRR